MLGRILLTLTGLAVTGFVLLVLIGLWDRHEQEITAGLSGIYERYLASQAGPSSNPRARTAAEAERAGAVGRVAKTQTFQEQMERDAGSATLSRNGRTPVLPWRRGGLFSMGRFFSTPVLLN